MGERSIEVVLRLALVAIAGQRLRSALSALGIAVGIASVILLSSIGDGARRYVLEQFTQFGTNVLAIHPGSTETLGVPGVLGGSTRKLTIEDALSLARLPSVERVVPISLGQARVEAGERGRSVYVFGCTADLTTVMRTAVMLGGNLPEGDPTRGAPVALLGPRVATELFGDESALGRFVRVAGARLRVVGVLAPKGQILGFDLDDAAYLPVATHMQIFDQEELHEIDVLFHAGADPEGVADEVRRALADRHGGNEDFSVITQTAMLALFDRVLSGITAAMAGIAAISLAVGALGIATMTWIGVGERTSEIGLLRALGATRATVLRLFLVEAAAIASLGGLSGLLLAGAAIGALRALVPGLPLGMSPGYALAGLAVSAAVGALSGLMPAGRAARLDPIDALRAE